jgi:hypothetical protein
MLPYFRKSEQHWDRGADPVQHSSEGPMDTSSVSATHLERKGSVERAAGGSVRETVVEVEWGWE